MTGTVNYILQNLTPHIGHMHEEKILGNTPKIPLASFSLIKVGMTNPLVKNIDFQGGNSHWGYFPRFFLHA